MHSLSIFGVGMNHKQFRIHKTHHGPDLGEATTFPLIVYFFPLHKWRAPKSRGETHLKVPQSQVTESWDLEAHSRLPTLERGRGSSWEPKD
jgi:hypothetical protein